jgi:DNA-binding Lrp family transcriptional regulator
VDVESKRLSDLVPMLGFRTFLDIRIQKTANCVAVICAPLTSRARNEVEQQMVKAFVLIVTDPGATRRVATALKAIEHVTDVHEVMGPYDIVVELEALQLPDIPPILSEHIRTMDGIQSTTSLVAFPV